MDRRERLMNELELVFRNVFRKMRKDMNELLGEQMTSTEFIFLKMLAEKGPQMVTALAQEFDVTVSHITAVSDRLVKKGWVRRQRSETDRRVVELCITQEGREWVKRIEQKKKEFLQRKFDSFETEEMEILVRLLDKLL
ncbi:MarR family transcriptional regulator [Bacillaceae bacterium]